MKDVEFFTRSRKVLISILLILTYSSTIGCNKEGSLPPPEVSAQLSPILFFTLQAPAAPPYHMTLIQNDTIKIPAFLPVLRLKKLKMSLTEMEEIGSALGMKTAITIEYGGNPEQLDSYVSKSDVAVCRFSAELWEWSYDEVSSWGIPDDGSRPMDRLTSDTVYKIIRNSLVNKQVLPDGIHVVERIRAMKGVDNDEKSPIALYGLIFTKPFRGYEFLGTANSALISVSWRRRVCKISARWLPLEEGSTYPLRSVEDAFKALKEGRGDFLYGDFIDATATFSGIFYWSEDIPMREFHPLYRFTVKDDGNTCYLFSPAIKDEFYENGTACRWSEKRQILTEADIVERIDAILRDITKNCQDLVKGVFKLDTLDDEKVLITLGDKTEKLIISLGLNSKFCASREWVKRVLDLGKQLFDAIGENPNLDIAGVHAIRAQVARKLCNVVLENGQDNERRLAKDLLDKYAEQVKWDGRVLFGVER